MKYNRLGTSDLFVSELSLGTMTFGEMEGQPTLGGLTQMDAQRTGGESFRGRSESVRHGGRVRPR
jgi:aryl-alcohol dehydrogenase-like predicted oxidoreductase